jgi:XTP/dITP diphosphohydrolase
MTAKNVKRILLATTNYGKKCELQAMLAGIDIEVCSLDEFENIIEVVEDGASFAENARKKALGYAEQSGLWTLADDSGLEVDYLGGEPGVNSARFSGAHKDHSSQRNLIDYQNIKKLLGLLDGVVVEKRTARFVCALALAKPGKILFETFGTLEGTILNELQGEGGFGYDPVFFVPQAGKTTAQMSKEEKNSISHRHNALIKLKPFLDAIEGVK